SGLRRLRHAFQVVECVVSVACVEASFLRSLSTIAAALGSSNLANRGKPPESVILILPLLGRRRANGHEHVIAAVGIIGNAATGLSHLGRTVQGIVGCRCKRWSCTPRSTSTHKRDRRSVNPAIAVICRVHTVEVA